MTQQVYTHKDIQLKGIMTKEMIETLGIPIKKTKKHGVFESPYNTCELYEVPAPYNEIDIFYGVFDFDSELVPEYYFRPSEIKKYNLTPVGEDEIPNFVCYWNLYKEEGKSFEVIGRINKIYNRKNEEKYRLRFLMDPDFDPRRWESEYSRKES